MVVSKSSLEKATSDFKQLEQKLIAERQSALDQLSEAKSLLKTKDEEVKQRGEELMAKFQTEVSQKAGDIAKV